MRQSQQQNGDSQNPAMPTKSNMKSVGINLSLGADAKVNQPEIGAYLQSKLMASNLNARIGTGGTDYVLNVEVKKAKESAAGKVGGLFGKVTGVDTKVGKTEVELVMTLTRSDSGASVTQSRIAQKYDGSASEAVKAAIDDAIGKVLSGIEN